MSQAKQIPLPQLLQSIANRAIAVKARCLADCREGCKTACSSCFLEKMKNEPCLVNPEAQPSDETQQSSRSAS